MDKHKITILNMQGIMAKRRMLQVTQKQLANHL